MYLLNNKNYLCKKNYSNRKAGGETQVNNFKCIFPKSKDIVSAFTK